MILSETLNLVLPLPLLFHSLSSTYLSLRTAAPPQTNKRRSRLSTVSVEDESDPLYESLEEVHVLALAHVLRCKNSICTFPTLPYSGDRSL